MQSIRASSRGNRSTICKSGDSWMELSVGCKPAVPRGELARTWQSPPRRWKVQQGGQAPTPGSAARGPRKEKAATAASASDSMKGETPAKFQIRFFATVHEDWKRQLLQHQRRTLGKGGNARKNRNRIWCDSPRRLEEAEFSKPGRGAKQQ